MVALGRANSRMKDYYDIWLMSQGYEFNPERLANAIAATFRRRDTPIPEIIPDGLTPEFSADPNKLRQWSAFTDDLSPAPSLGTVVSQLSNFLMPHSRAATHRHPK